MSEADIENALAGVTVSFAESESVLLSAAEELLATESLSDHMWTAITSLYDDRSALEFVFLVGYYRMIAGFLNSVGVQLD